jgi:hypothetical protein
MLNGYTKMVQTHGLLVTMPLLPHIFMLPAKVLSRWLLQLMMLFLQA